MCNYYTVRLQMRLYFVSEFFGSKNYRIFLQNLDMVKRNNAFVYKKGCPQFLDHILHLKTRQIIVYVTYQPACLFDRPD